MITKDRFSIGENKVVHKGVVTRLLLGVPSYDRLVENLPTLLEYEIGNIPAGVEHRPDMISYIFYNTPAYWWLLMLVNNVDDPFEGFNVGDRILLPKI